ncbi:efflux RND transporter permease subunit, partial [Candidatus Dependentiae bacterium]|nr:efflux RND transporter permease subunit [Candidatus Dependentiae bacterium]
MFLSDISVRRPIAMLCLIIGLTLLGLNAYRKIGVELFPQMDVPYITVTVIYPGASPEQLEVDVAKKIENQVVSIAGLKHVTSSCMENVCNILLEFEMGINVDVAATDVREKIDLIKKDLPEEAEDPIIVKFDVNSKPVVNLALTGTQSVEDLYDYADNKLRDKISVISGVADVTLVGGSENEIHVLIDRDKIAARGLTSLNVVNAISSGIKTIPAGRIKDYDIEYSVEFRGEYDEISEIGNFEIANNAGQRCYINNIGKIQKTSGEQRQKTFVNGESAIGIKVVKKSDANSVRVVNDVRRAIEKIKNELPEGMKINWVNDDGRFIESSLDSAWSDVFQGILLTALILFFFLYNIRSLIIVCISMPLTIIIGLFIMKMCGYTLNISTLLAIGMSVGILVTNSIVVLESIVKNFEITGNAKRAAIEGSSKVGLAVIASVGTNLVVLIPIAMMGGIIASFLRPLALTMAIMTVISLFISFTLTPLLASLILRPKQKNSKSIILKMEKLWNFWFEKVIDVYRSFLVISLKRKFIIIIILFLTILFIFHSMKNFGGLGFSFVSESDMGQLTVKLEFPTYYNINQTELRVKEIESRINDIPELKSVFTTIGKVDGIIGQSSEGVYLAQIILVFTDKDKRKLTLDDIQNILRPKLTNIPDCIISVNVPSPVGGSGSELELEFSGEDLKMIDDFAVKLKEHLDNESGFKDIDVSVRQGKPKLRIIPNRAVLSDLKIAPVNFGLSLRGNLEGI